MVASVVEHVQRAKRWLCVAAPASPGRAPRGAVFWQRARGGGTDAPGEGPGGCGREFRQPGPSTPPPASCIPPFQPPSPSFLSWSEAPDLDKCYVMERDLASPSGPRGHQWKCMGWAPEGQTWARGRGRQEGPGRETHPSLWSAVGAASLANFSGVGWGGEWSLSSGHPAGMDSSQHTHR